MDSFKARWLNVHIVKVACQIFW